MKDLRLTVVRNGDNILLIDYNAQIEEYKHRDFFICDDVIHSLQSEYNSENKTYIDSCDIYDNGIINKNKVVGKIVASKNKINDVLPIYESYNDVSICKYVVIEILDGISLDNNIVKIIGWIL